eukprot:gene4845-48223_t
MGMYTADLDHYVKAFQADGVPTFISSFTDPETQKVYHSCLVQAEGSLAAGTKANQNIEFIGESSGVAAGAASHP